MALEITDSNFQEILAEGKPVVMDFWAPWCGPCKMVGPIIDELATEYEGKVIIGKCDVDENGDVAAEYGIRNIPTVLCSEICLRGQDRSDIIRYYLTIYYLRFTLLASWRRQIVNSKSSNSQ